MTSPPTIPRLDGVTDVAQATGRRQAVAMVSLVLAVVALALAILLCALAWAVGGPHADPAVVWMFPMAWFLWLLQLVAAVTGIIGLFGTRRVRAAVGLGLAVLGAVVVTLAQLPLLERLLSILAWH